MSGKKTKEVIYEGWKALLDLYQGRIDELEEQTEDLQKVVRTIKQQIEKLS